MIEDWVRLGALLEDDPEVGKAIRHAGRDGGDVRAALFDALDDAGALAYMEWSDSGVELADALAQPWADLEAQATWVAICVELLDDERNVVQKRLDAALWRRGLQEVVSHVKKIPT